MAPRIVNASFQDGQTGWTLTPDNNVKGHLTAVSGFIAGWINDYVSPNGFPHVSRTYCCLARDFGTATTSNGVSTLASTASYSFDSGDVVAVRIGWSKLGTVSASYNAFELKIGSTSIGTFKWTSATPALWAGDFVGKCGTALSGVIKLEWNTSTTTANTGMVADWVCADNFRCYPAFPAQAFDNEF